MDIYFLPSRFLMGSWIVKNQQLRKTELASKTAEINHAPLCEKLGLNAKHGQRLN
jgi:hypothetical protein